MAPNEEPATCVTCGAALTAKYCPACGEKRLGPEDHELGHFADGLVESLTHADGKIFRSLWLLLSQPGRLTAEYLAGRRKPFLKPLALFLVANTLVFIGLPILGWNTLTTSLAIHLHNQPYSRLARAIFERRFPTGLHVPVEFAREFDAHGSVLAKSLVIVMVPLFALLVWACFFRARRHYLDHLVFALHVYAFWLLYMLASLGILEGSLRLVISLGWRPSDSAIDNVATFTGYSIYLLYLYHAVRRVYGATPVAGRVKAVVLAVGLFGGLEIYRFFLFFMTNSTI